MTDEELTVAAAYPSESFACPSCGGDDLEIAASMWVRLLQRQDGTFETEPSTINGDHEWDDDSNAVCMNCRWNGRAGALRRGVKR